MNGEALTKVIIGLSIVRFIENIQIPSDEKTETHIAVNYHFYVKI